MIDQRESFKTLNPSLHMVSPFLIHLGFLCSFDTGDHNIQISVL